MSEEGKIRLIEVTMPRLDSLILAIPEDEKYKRALRCDVMIADTRKVGILFGVKIESEENIQDQPKASVTAEVIGEFETTFDIPEVKTISEVPFLPNMLAVLIPFVREKIAFCFTSNHGIYYLPMINAVQLVKDGEGKEPFRIFDHRSAAE